MYVQAGGGVVADSDPEAEYQESCNKARALIRAAEEAVRFASGAAELAAGRQAAWRRCAGADWISVRERSGRRRWSRPAGHARSSRARSRADRDEPKPARLGVGSQPRSAVERGRVGMADRQRVRRGGGRSARLAASWRRMASGSASLSRNTSRAAWGMPSCCARPSATDRRGRAAVDELQAARRAARCMTLSIVVADRRSARLPMWLLTPTTPAARAVERPGEATRNSLGLEPDQDRVRARVSRRRSAPSADADRSHGRARVPRRSAPSRSSA